MSLPPTLRQNRLPFRYSSEANNRVRDGNGCLLPIRGFEAIAGTFFEAWMFLAQRHLARHYSIRVSRHSPTYAPKTRMPGMRALVLDAPNACLDDTLMRASQCSHLKA